MNARQQLAEGLGSRIPGCVVGTKFGHGSLHVGDKIFAFARPDDSAALKLPEARIAELLAGGGEMHLLQMGPRTLREWLVVPNAVAPENLKLLREAMAYVASLPPEKKKPSKKKAAKSATRSAAKKAPTSKSPRSGSRTTKRAKRSAKR